MHITIRKQGTIRRWTDVAGCALAMACPAWAQNAPGNAPTLQLKIDMQKEVMVEKDGKTISNYVAADQSARNDVLRITVTYTNTGAQEATGASVVDPIPQGTVFQPGSATGQDTEILYSFDGGKNFKAPPLKYTETKPDGTTIEKEVPPERYTHLKWEIKKMLPAGQSGQVSFKVKVK